VFVGVIEMLKWMRNRLRSAVASGGIHTLNSLGTIGDRGYSPFEDNTFTGCDTAFAKIEAGVAGTRMAAERPGR
jgi:5-methyltetrahydropteroyltriglutamate--homocysteine methyltransferase